MAERGEEEGKIMNDEANPWRIVRRNFPTNKKLISSCYVSSSERQGIGRE